MNILQGILLIAGVVLIWRDEKLKKPFLKWFGLISLGLLIFYLIFDPSQFTQIGNIIGIIFLAFLMAIIITFIRKWIAHKEKQNSV